MKTGSLWVVKKMKKLTKLTVEMGSVTNKFVNQEIINTKQDI